MNKTPLEPYDFNRREFLRGSSLASFAALLAANSELRARAEGESKGVEKAVTAVNTAVIGLGNRGREAVSVIGSLTNGNLVAICDTYPAALKRAGQAAPKARQIADFKELLADKTVEAIVVCTPPHQHREITLAALDAGKHVYCEVPLAMSIDEAREIARAGRKASRQIFQPGLQERSHPQRQFLYPFIRSGSGGTPIKARSQWHKKTSWRATSPNSEREQALNWKLNPSTSPGLIGEIGIHQVDVISWFLGMRPKAVNGFGTVIQWKDGREVADTVQAVFEYPRDVRYTADFTLGNSFDADYEMLYGTDAAVMMRENKSWMFKESDSPLLGWEVYARKDQFYKELGIALMANATKIAAQGPKPAEEAPYPNPPLFYALEAFLFNTHELTTGVKDYIENFGGEDAKALQEHIATIKLLPAATWKEGFESTLMGLKANEAVTKNTRIVFEDHWFEV